MIQRTEPSDALAPTLSPRWFQHTSNMPPVPRYVWINAPFCTMHTDDTTRTSVHKIPQPMQFLTRKHEISLVKSDFTVCGGPNNWNEISPQIKHFHTAPASSPSSSSNEKLPVHSRCGHTCRRSRWRCVVRRDWKLRCKPAPNDELTYVRTGLSPRPTDALSSQTMHCDIHTTHSNNYNSSSIGYSSSSITTTTLSADNTDAICKKNDTLWCSHHQ